MPRRASTRANRQAVGSPRASTSTPQERTGILPRQPLVHRGSLVQGDTVYDSNEFVQAVRERGKKPAIHSKLERKHKHRLDRKLHRQRYQVERFLHELKRPRDSLREDGSQPCGTCPAWLRLSLARPLSSSARGRPGAARTGREEALRERSERMPADDRGGHGRAVRGLTPPFPEEPSRRKPAAAEHRSPQSPLLPPRIGESPSDGVTATAFDLAQSPARRLGHPGLRG